MRIFRLASVMVLALAFVGCEDLTDLDVVNQNAPDAERAIATPGDVESLIGGAFLTWWNTQKYTPGMPLSATADEGTMSWGNFGTQNLSSEPRVAYENTQSYRYRTVVEDPWYDSYRALSAVYDGLVAINGGLEIGTNGADTPRALAFAKLVQGISHGFLALMFDQAFIFDEAIDLQNDVLEMKSYGEVMTAAIGYLSEAATIADGNTFQLPVTWINGEPLSSTELSGLAHGFIARLMTQVARTPAERDAVAWGTVVTHVDQYLSKMGRDFIPIGDGNFWWAGIKYLGQQPIWMRSDYKTIGWTDRDPATGAGYDRGDRNNGFAAWMATPVDDRIHFELNTPDLRIWDGTRSGTGAQNPGLDFMWRGNPNHRPDRGTYHFSAYSHIRYIDHLNNGAVGPMPHMNLAEMNLLKAEGLYRQNGVTQQVVDLINLTRVNRGGLTALTTADSPAYVLDALIYEDRIETFHLAAGGAFFDRRGRGPLAPTGPAFHHGPVEGTPAHFPVPAKELEILQMQLYTFGGVGAEMGPAAASAVMPSQVRVPAKALYQPEPSAHQSLNGAGQLTRY